MSDLQQRIEALAGETLLPPGSTPFERTQSLTDAARRPLPAHLIKDVWSAERCPLPLLPYLSWGLSVDVWDEDWDETKKRQVTAKSLALHRIKTTPAGIKAHVALTGAEVRRIERPPARGHLRAAMTDEARQAWLESLPAIQIRPFVQPAVAANRGFLSGAMTTAFHGPRTASNGARELSRWMRPSRGLDLWGRRAFYVKGGVELQARLEQIAIPGQPLHDRVLITRAGSRRSFLSGVKRAWHGRGFLQSSTAADQVLTVRVSADAAAFAIEPTTTRVVDVRPTRIHKGRTVPAGRSFCGRHRFLGTRHLKATIAATMIYDRIALHDPSVAPRLRQVRDYHGRGRFGITPFTAELLVHVPMRRPSRRSGLWVGVGHVKRANLKKLWQAVDAVRVSKAARDTVLIDVKTTRVVTLRDAPQWGFKLGEKRQRVGATSRSIH